MDDYGYLLLNFSGSYGWYSVMEKRDCGLAGFLKDYKCFPLYTIYLKYVLLFWGGGLGWG